MLKLQITLFSLLILIISACGPSAKQQTSENMGLLSPSDFNNRISTLANYNLVDVRSPEEYATNHLKNAVNIDVNSANFQEKIAALDKALPVLVYCKSGGRSATASAKLNELGFNVFELEGGILNWQSQGLSVETNVKESNSGYTMATYSEAVKEGLVLVDFYATWCGPCKMMAPHIEDVKTEFGDRLQIVKVDTDRSLEVATHFSITGIPLVKIYKDGKEVYSKIGYHTKEALQEELKKHS